MSTTAPPEVDQLRYAIADGARRWWWLPLVTGIFWLIASLVILRFDTTSATAIGILTGVIFLVAGIEELFAIAVAEGGWRWLHAVLALILLAGGVFALANPVDTFLSIASLIGWILLFVGIFNIVLALSNRDIELWWLRLVVGIAAIILAISVSGNLSQKAIVLVIFIGAFAMVKGITNIIIAFQLRSIGKRARPA